MNVQFKDWRRNSDGTGTVTVDAGIYGIKEYSSDRKFAAPTADYYYAWRQYEDQIRGKILQGYGPFGPRRYLPIDILARLYNKETDNYNKKQHITFDPFVPIPLIEIPECVHEWYTFKNTKIITEKGNVYRKRCVFCKLWAFSMHTKISTQSKRIKLNGKIFIVFNELHRLATIHSVKGK